MYNIIDPHGLVSDFIDEWLSDSPFVIAHTSGSTGLPKKIHLSKSDMIRSAKATCRFFNIDSSSVLHLPLSVDYIAGKMMVVRAIVSGATLVVERPSNRPLAELSDGIGHVYLTAVVPSQVMGLLGSEQAVIVRNVIVGGGAMAKDVERQLALSSIRGWATYGMTETCSHVALRNVVDKDQIYRALPGIRFSRDERGCLIIEADGFSFRRVITNDIVHVVSPVEFEWLGRYDNVINSGGIKLHPEEMERRLTQVIDRPFYVVGRQSNRWGEEAVIVIEGLADAECEDILSKARALFDGPHAPKAVIGVDRFFYTATGKLRRIKISDYPMIR